MLVIRFLVENLARKIYNFILFTKHKTLRHLIHTKQTNHNLKRKFNNRRKARQIHFNNTYTNTKNKITSNITINTNFTYTI